jgi:NDP-sugar pyrophosphorylase family protein
MKAMILCAGYGTRLGNLTRELPKPMLPLQDRPLLAYVLGHLKAQGFTELALNLHFRPDLISGWLGDGSAWGLHLTYSHEATLLGTAGGVKNLAAFFGDTPAFLVQYGDVLTDQDFGALMTFHRERDALVTLLLHQRAQSNSVVSLDPTGRITGFLERPTAAERGTVSSPWVNSGVCVCAPVALDFIPPAVPSDLPRDLFPRLITTGRLFGFPLSGYRCAIDSPARLEEARQAIAAGRCRIQPLGANAPGLADDSRPAPA